jgi:glutamate-1-semialdehyde 2,1-aminomutase
MTATERREAFRQPLSASARLHEHARKVMPGGNTRTTVHMDPYPAYANRGRGAVVVDAEGEERLDFLNNYTSLIHGHADPDVSAAVIEQLQLGTAFGMPTPHEVALAELIVDRIPSVEHIRFTNSGTEAVMSAIQAARAYTNKPKIMKFEGSYHGSYDYAGVSTLAPESVWDQPLPPSTAYYYGSPQGMLDDVVVSRYNDFDLTGQLIESHKSDLAAVLIDPMPFRMGLIPGQVAFLEQLREMTRSLGIVLIFDEVISLRAAYGGYQSVVGVTPDMTTMAKIIGGGFPVGAVGGREEIMAVFDPRGGAPRVPHGGTFSANPMTMVAGLTAMRKMDQAAFDRLDALGNYLREGLAEAMDGARLEGQVTGHGSLFGIHMHARPLSDYRSSHGRLAERARGSATFNGMLAHGVIVSPALTGCLSTPMTEADANTLIDAFAAGLRESETA